MASRYSVLEKEKRKKRNIGNCGNSNEHDCKQKIYLLRLRSSGKGMRRVFGVQHSSLSVDKKIYLKEIRNQGGKENIPRIWI